MEFVALRAPGVVAARLRGARRARNFDRARFFRGARGRGRRRARATTRCDDNASRQRHLVERVAVHSSSRYRSLARANDSFASSRRVADPRGVTGSTR